MLIKCIFFFRDTGISLQIQLYQLYSEIFVFLTSIVSGVLFLFVNPINTIFVGKVTFSVAQFVVYVVQPLFYLHGDPSFRQSVMNLGIWHALKRSLPVCPKAAKICSKGFQKTWVPKVALEVAPQAVAPDAVAPQTVGPQAVGPQAVGPQAVGPQAVGPEAVGCEDVGPEAVGPEAVGPEAVGPEAVGPEAVGFV